jgi:hypothetical protein
MIYDSLCVWISLTVHVKSDMFWYYTVSEEGNGIICENFQGESKGCVMVC